MDIYKDSTPRPWESRKWDNDPAIGIFAADGTWVADVCAGDVPPEQQKAHAALILRAVNSQPQLLAACKNFREWWANHFDDFDAEINGQLLCLDNDAEAAIAAAEKGA